MRPAKGFLCAVCALAVLALAATAGAATRQVVFPIDDTFQDEFATEGCGFDVFVHVEGSVRIQLILDEGRNVVREVDTFVGSVTYYSDTGSFSFPLAQPAMLDYGEGAEIGSTATVKVVGLAGHVPGLISTDAGYILFTGTVTGFFEGVPDVEFSDLIVQYGNWNTSEDIITAICTALS
jgi:hypothetical protein